MCTITVLGGVGFVGSRYCLYAQHELQINKRNDYEVRGDNVVNFISTVSNYNVFRDVHVDIDTNLNLLMDLLESWRKNGARGIWNQISSWFTYGNVDLPAKEEYNCNPKGFYSITKRAAEQLV